MNDGREAFDAALIPGMRERLALAYQEFRARESDLIKSLAPPQQGGRTGRYNLRDCPLCGATSAEGQPVLEAHGLTLVKCSNCALTYSREVMEESADSERYRASGLDQATADLRLSPAYLELESARARYYLSLLQRHCTPGRLLEIGSGYGTFLDEAGKLGWDALGLEPGAAAAEASARRGVHVVEGYFPDDLPEPNVRFAAVAALDVLEHFASPLRLLSQIKARLASSGRLLLQVPNWDSLLVRLEGASSSVVCPGHWSYFTPETLEALLARAGFRALEIETVQSEIDRQAAFSADEILRMLAVLRPGEKEVPGPRRLHELRMGYKLIGIFAPAT